MHTIGKEREKLPWFTLLFNDSTPSLHVEMLRKKNGKKGHKS